MLKQRLRKLTDLFFPPRCVFCNCVIPVGQELCPSCQESICLVHYQERVIMGSSGNDIICMAPLRYQTLVRKSILLFKYYGKLWRASYFGKMIAEEVLSSEIPFHIDLVTCVPMSRKKQKNRGYNQSEVIAKEAVKLLNLPYKNLLEKLRDNTEQHTLSARAREFNTVDVYSLVHDKDIIQGKNILLIDDIITTGSTVKSCAEVLQKGGAGNIVCCAIAKDFLH